MKPQSEYEKFEATPAGRRSLLQEELIFNTTESLYVALEESGMTKADLAARLGKTRAFVTQLLGGGRNLTLRTLADVADALGHSVQIKIISSESKVLESVWEGVNISVGTAIIRTAGYGHGIDFKLADKQIEFSIVEDSESTGDVAA